MPGLVAMAAGILVAGLGISATLVSSYSIAERIGPAGRRTQGMSWLTTAASTGTAIGSSLARQLVDAHGASAGFCSRWRPGSSRYRDPHPRLPPPRQS